MLYVERFDNGHQQIGRLTFSSAAIRFSPSISVDSPLLSPVSRKTALVTHATRAAIVVMYNFPIVKKATLEALETIFATKTIARQLALAVALEAGVVTFSQFFAVVNSVLANFSSRSRLIRHLQKQQNEAPSQDEWTDLAERIDNVQGNDVWRSDPNSLLYERDRISARIDEFVHLMRRRDIFELMFVLRGGIGRNKFGLLHEGLFSKAMAGTKVLVETYVTVAVQLLAACCLLLSWPCLFVLCP